MPSAAIQQDDETAKERLRSGHKTQSRLPEDAQVQRETLLESRHLDAGFQPSAMQRCSHKSARMPRDKGRHPTLARVPKPRPKSLELGMNPSCPCLRPQIALLISSTLSSSEAKKKTRSKSKANDHSLMPVTIGTPRDTPAPL
jgi:hypothetical protein